MSTKLVKPALLGIFLLLFVVVNPANLKAESRPNPYLVNNVFVSTTGKNATEAREIAIAQARRSAFVTLLSRLSIDEAFSDNITSEEISDMVHSEQITNEKIAGPNYSANFNIAFSESFVTNILARHNISKKTVKQDSYLIIPIKNTRKSELLWEKDNDWKAAWETFLKDNPNSRIKVPNGTLDDITHLNVEIANEGSYENFESILNRYKADVAIVIYFNFDSLENKVSLLLKTIRRFQNQQIRLSFVNVNQLSPSELLSKVTEKTIEHVLSAKEQHKISGSKITLDIEVPVSNLGEWTATKTRLENLNFLEELNINSISRNNVKITIKYDKNSGDLAALFAKYNFALKSNQEGTYLLFPNLIN